MTSSPADAVIDHPDALTVYECDGYALERATRDVVVLPRTAEQVATVVRLPWEEQVPFATRGAGTGPWGARCQHRS